MMPAKRLTDLAVLLLHNVDSSWELSEIAAVNEAVSAMTCALMQAGHPVVEVPVTHSDLVEILKPFSPESCIVFNWCEDLPGIPRSDVKVTEILEALKFAYTGASPQILSLSWDKAAVKTLMNAKSIPLPRWRLFSAPEPDGWNCFPAIVKPAYEHCSYGISADAVVMNTEDLMKRIAFVRDTFKQPAIVEDFIDGREFHVTLWGNSDVEMLPPAEMDFAAFNNLRDRLCTFDSKFKPGSLHYEKIDMRIPAKLTVKEYRRLKQTALSAYQVTGCRDYARIDLRLREGIFYVLDVNPNADLSPETSMIFAAETVGLTYGAVGSRLINLAAWRHPVLTGGQMIDEQPRLQAVME